MIYTGSRMRLRNTRSIAVRACALVFALAVGLAAPSSACADSLAKVRVHLKWLHQFQSAGFFVALERGYYREAGLDVTLIEGGPGKAPVETMLAGGAEFAVGDAGALLYRAAGKPVVLLASLFQHSPQVIYTRDDVHELKELRGRRVMMQPGYLTVEVLAMLKAVGLGENDFVRIPIGVIEDLVEGRTDAFPGYSTNEGFWLAKHGIPYRVFRPRDYGIDFYGDTLLTTERMLRQRPEVVRAFRDATLRGWRDAIADLEGTVDLILRKYNTQHKSREHLMYEARGIRDLMATSLVPVGYSNPERWEAIRKVFAREGFPVADLRLDGFFYREPLTMRSFLKRHAAAVWVAGLALLTVLIALYAVLLRRMVSARTRDVARAKAELQRILDNMQDTYFRTDPQGRIIWASRSCEQLLGWPREAILGKPLPRLYRRKRDRDRLLAALEAGGGRITNYVTPLQTRDGREIWVSAAVQYCLDDKGRRTGIEGVVRDITELKQAQDERQQLTEQLLQAQKMESIGVLAGGIAHDFNNLLVGVMGNAELAMLDLPDGHPAKDALRGIFKAARRGSDLVRQMLAYAGKGQMGVDRQNLNEIVSEIGELMGSAVGRHVTLAIELADRLPDVRADRNQMTQMVMNLITNAAEALKGKPGTVAVRTGHLRLAEVPPNAVLAEGFRPGPYVFLQVRDDGIGMDLATRRRIFDPFFTTKPEGTGLGLAALLGIVRSHRGLLTLKTAPRQGSVFTVFLPALPGLPRQAEPSTDSFRAVEPRRGLVLIVDDEDQVRHVARRLLEREGIQVLEASDGREALRLFRQRRDEIALVLLDLTMPLMGGAETFRAMRAIRPEVPVLLASGYDRTEAIDALLAEGVAGFVRKPFTRKTLLSEVMLRLERADA